MLEDAVKIGPQLQSLPIDHQFFLAQVTRGTKTVNPGYSDRCLEGPISACQTPPFGGGQNQWYNPVV